MSTRYLGLGAMLSATPGITFGASALFMSCHMLKCIECVEQRSIEIRRHSAGWHRHKRIEHLHVAMRLVYLHQTAACMCQGYVAKMPDATQAVHALGWFQ